MVQEAAVEGVAIWEEVVAVVMEEEEEEEEEGMALVYNPLSQNKLGRIQTAKQLHSSPRM
jgi:hypothetical protein